MSSRIKKAGLAAVGVSAALLIAACSSSSSSSSSSSTAPSSPAASASSSASATASASASATGSTASLSVGDITPTFGALAALKPLAAQGKGSVTAILPDTVSSTRWQEFDAPYLKSAFAAAGLPASDLTVENALGSDTTQVSMAQTAISKGASVLIICPLDSGTGAHIESLAKAAGVQVIDYDRLTLGGSRAYYVSFNNVKVGQVMGQGLVQCISAWGVKNPNIIVMKGAPTDNNATLFAQGYDGVLAPYFSKGTYKNVGTTAGTWDPPTALSEFQQQYTAHKSINAALTPNDENAAPIITYLKSQGIKAKTFPMTGQDATLTGLQNILTGYQCGTVYKPIFFEAGASAALAMYLRAGQTPPASLVNGTTEDTQAKVSVPSVLANPEWVTTANMNSTIIADNFVPASQLCVGSYKAECTAAGITG